MFSNSKISNIIGNLKGIILENKLKIYLIILILALIFPFITNNQYYIYIGVLTLMYMILASSLNIIVGYTYQYLIGFAGFFAIGSYTTAIITTSFKVNFIFVFLISGIIASFFAFATLGFGEIIRLIIINWDTLTRGTFGIPGIPRPKLFNFIINTNTNFYFFALLILLVQLFISYRVINSRVGRAWLSLKENSEAAKAMGIKIAKYRVLNLMYGTFWAGIGGAFYAYFTQYVSPDTFVLDEGFRIFAMVLVGGMGTLIGPIAGSGLLTILPELVREFARYQLIIYGVAILLIIHYRPQGLFGAKELAQAKVKDEK